MNTHRRIFRGRGGPTDRRLPKHNARRRKMQQLGQAHPQETRDVPEEEEILVVVVPPEKDDESTASEVMIVEENLASDEQDNNIVMEVEEEGPKQNDSACYKEMEHLQKRAQKVRESIQLSTAIANPTVYKQNVLNVVSKCVKEWRSIVTHHKTEVDPDNPTTKKTSLAVFGLIQHSIQCGPLVGAKPGYFKRCGGEVARVVFEYLNSIVPHSELGILMGFTQKQLDVLGKWKANAQKAAESDKPPSKSALKKQQKKKK